MHPLCQTLGSCLAWRLTTSQVGSNLVWRGLVWWQRCERYLCSPVILCIIVINILQLINILIKISIVNKHFQLVCSEQRVGIGLTDKNTVFFNFTLLELQLLCNCTCSSAGTLGEGCSSSFHRGGFSRVPRVCFLTVAHPQLCSACPDEHTAPSNPIPPCAGSKVKGRSCSASGAAQLTQAEVWPC